CVAGRGMSARRADEVLEEGMTGERLGFELRVKLTAEEPGMPVPELDDLHEFPVRRHSAKRHPRFAQGRNVFLVDLVAVPVPFGDQVLRVGARRDRSGGELARILSEAHGAAESLDADKIPKLEDDLVPGLLVEFSRVRLFEAGDVAGELDDRGLEAQADPEIRDLLLAGVPNRLRHALDASTPETAGHEDRVGP